MFGTILPFIGRVLGPCDADGNPAMNDEEAAAARFETGAVCIAWFGCCAMFPFGDVMPRAIDPSNPRQYLTGNL